MFCVVGDAVLERLRSLREEGSGAPVQCARLASSVLPASRGRDPPTWFVGIGRWLPETWSDAEIASKAVSADNANVDYRPWNLFTLVFPLASPSVICDFEVLGLCRWRHVLSCSFFAYLWGRYGPKWVVRLASARGHWRGGCRKRSQRRHEVMHDHD